MADFNVRSDSVNVEQIMEQIRARIREKRGVDYTEEQIRELAAVKLEKFLDPQGVRSDLLEEFRRMRPAADAPPLPNYTFDDSTLFETHRAPIRWIRRLLLPILKLFFNPNPLIQALHIQSRLNTRHIEAEAARRARDQLTFEVLHNLVLETTRLGIEMKNLKMRVESVSSRLDFGERRARALESAVVYKSSSERDVERRGQGPADARQRPEMPRGEPSSGGAAGSAAPASGPATTPGPGGLEGQGQRSRRRRRRRGRRSGPPAAALMGTSSPPAVDGSVAAPADRDTYASPAEQPEPTAEGHRESDTNDSEEQ